MRNRQTPMPNLQPSAVSLSLSLTLDLISLVPDIMPHCPADERMRNRPTPAVKLSLTLSIFSVCQYLTTRRHVLHRMCCQPQLSGAEAHDCLVVKSRGYGQEGKKRNEHSCRQSLFIKNEHNPNRSAGPIRFGVCRN